MEYEVIDLPGENQPVNFTNNESGFFGKIKKGLSDTGVTGLAHAAVTGPLKLLEAPANIANWLNEKLGSPFEEFSTPKVPYLQDRSDTRPASEAVSELFNQENIKPGNTVSKALQYTAANWPLLLIGGGTLPLKIAGDLAGSLGISAAEDLGGGPISQLSAGLLSSYGFGKAAKGLANYKNGVVTKGEVKPGKIGNYISELYTKEKDLGSKIKVGPDKKLDILSKLDKLHEKVGDTYTGKNLTPEMQKDLLDNISRTDRLVRKSGDTGSGLFDIKRGLNQSYNNNPLYKELRGIVVDELDSLSKANPEWGNAWKTADELFTIQSWQTKLGQYLDQKAQSGLLGKIATNPITQASLGILGGLAGNALGGPVGSVVGGAPGALTAGANIITKGTESVKKAIDFMGYLGKSKEGRNLLLEIMLESATNKGTKLASTINKLDKKANKFSKELDYYEVVDA